MNNQLTVYNGLQQCFGISVSPCNSNNLENSIIIDDNLYTTIENSLKTEFGMKQPEKKRGFSYEKKKAPVKRIV